MQKINLNDLREARGDIPFTSKNVEVEKSVKEIIASKKALDEAAKIPEKVEGTSKEEEIAEKKTEETTAKVEQKPENKAYVAHGALPPESTNNIEAILKKFKRSPYDKWSTTAEYYKAINVMSTSQLHEHAVEVQVIPTSDKEKLIRNLENAFGVYINKHAPRIFPPSNYTVKNKEEIEKIIASKMPRRY